MKELIASLILLTVVVTLVIINAFYVDSTLEKLDRLADRAFNEPSEKSLAELIDYWERHRSFVGLSASLREVDSVPENMLNLQTSFREGNSVMAEQSYSLLCNALDDIRRYEKLSIINIF